MYTSEELHGMNAMMPAFAKEGATELDAVDTVDVENLTDAVNRLIDDGVDVISTTGSYGECYTLLFEEFQTLVTATLEAVRGRVPVFIGVTQQNAREAVRRARFAREVGAEGLFVGVPYYYVPTVDNAVAFYRDFSAMFPDMSIQIYHNPPLHRIHIPVAAFEEIGKIPNFVSMKDSHRSPMEFIALQKYLGGKVSMFTNQLQFYPYIEWGAKGFWTSACWMGPWPLLYLRDVVEAGDYERAKEVLFDISGGRAHGAGGDEDARPNDNARKLGASYAGYSKQGPNRYPYAVVRPESLERAIKSAGRWTALCEKYRPLYEATQTVGASGGRSQ